MKKINFSEVFGEIYSKYGKKLESYRKSAIIKCIIVIIFIRCIIIKLNMSSISESLYMAIFFGLIIIFLLICKLIIHRYKELFKLNAIKTLVESQNDTYKYNPKYGLSSSEYGKSGFDRGWDEFYSEDYIEGDITSMVNFKMSQVKTVEIDRTDDKTTRIITFLGLFGVINLPVFSKGNLDILGDSSSRKNAQARINLESQEFEKNYDVLADNKIWALQILDSESIEMLIEMRKCFKKSISIRIRGNKIYFRLDCGDVFEAPKMKSSVNFDLLYKYYRFIDIPRCIYEMLIENIARNSDDKEFARNVKYGELKENDESEDNKENEENGWFSSK